MSTWVQLLACRNEKAFSSINYLGFSSYFCRLLFGIPDVLELVGANQWH